jgi:hypothetical protein
MEGLNSYYALQDARKEAEKNGKDWDSLSQDIKDDYIVKEMKKRGYERGGYIGHGSYKWVKK